MRDNSEIWSAPSWGIGLTSERGDLYLIPQHVRNACTFFRHCPEHAFIGLSPDIAESCHLFRMAIKNLNQADGSFARLHCATLILLERSTPTADNPASFLLGQTQLLTNGLDPRCISRAQFMVSAFYSLQIFAGVNRIAIVLRIPTGDTHIL